MSDIEQETLFDEQPIPVPIEGIRKILFQMENCTCKIYPENGKKGTGFFCKIPFLNNYLPVLITNNHVLNEKDIKNNKIIQLSIKANNVPINIEIGSSRKKYTNPDKNIDITIIEIKPKEDGIGKNNFLELDENEINKNKENIELDFKNKSIYILHYPKGKLSVSYGLLKNIIDNKQIYHFCSTEDGSSGGPILSLETFKVIGIHFGYNNKSQFKINYGTFIKYAVDLFNIFYNNKSDIINNSNKNKYPLNFGSEKKKINKNMFNKTKENLFNNINFIIESFKLIDNKKNHYNKYKYNKDLIQNDISLRLLHNIDKKNTDSNLGTITDKNNSKINYTNYSRNPEKTYSNKNLIKFSKNTNSYIDNHNYKGNTYRKMNESKNINYYSKSKLPNPRKQFQNKDFKSHNQSMSSINKKNKTIKLKSNQKFKKIKNIKFENRKIIEKLDYKKNQKMKEPIYSCLPSDKKRNTNSDIEINNLNNFISKKEFNNQKFIIKIKNLELRKKLLKLKLNEIDNKETYLNSIKLNYDNNSRYLKEERKRMLSETKENIENQILKFKNDKNKKISIYFKHNNISLKKANTIENNSLKKFISNLNNKRSEQKDEGNKSFSKTGINFKRKENLMEKELKANLQTSSLIKFEKSKTNSYKQINISNKVSLDSDIKEKIDENMKNNLMISQSCKNGRFSNKLRFKKEKRENKNHSFVDNKIEIIYKKLFDGVSEDKIKNISK